MNQSYDSDNQGLRTSNQGFRPSRFIARNKSYMLVGSSTKQKGSKFAEELFKISDSSHDRLFLRYLVSLGIDSRDACMKKRRQSRAFVSATETSNLARIIARNRLEQALKEQQERLRLQQQATSPLLSSYEG